MLVITRKLDEAIIIGDGIEIHVLRVGRDGVRIGVVAPPALPVHRHEIHAQICAANRAAADPGQRSAIEARLKGRLP